MKTTHGYAITFSAIRTKGVDGENVYRSSYAIAAQDDVQLLGERRLSSFVVDGVPLSAPPARSTS